MVINIYPVQEIGEIAQKYEIPFLGDASQAVGKIPINFEQWGITYLAIKWHLTLPDTLESLLDFSRRRCDKQHLICLFNLSSKPLHHNLSDYPECVEADESDFVNRRCDNTVEIPAYGVFFGNCLNV